MNEAVSHLPAISLNENEINRTRSGLQLKRENFQAADDQPVRMTDAEGNLIAVGFFDESENIVRPKIVLV